MTTRRDGQGMDPSSAADVHSSAAEVHSSAAGVLSSALCMQNLKSSEASAKIN